MDKSLEFKRSGVASKRCNAQNEMKKCYRQRDFWRRNSAQVDYPFQGFTAQVDYAPTDKGTFGLESTPMPWKATRVLSIHRGA
jgi:hypothetical protein